MKRIQQLALWVLVLSGINGCAVEGPIVPGPAPYYYEYYYYPSVRVYFNLQSGYYHYFTDGRWVRSTTLPPRIRLDSRDRHPIRTKEPAPYQRNQEYQSRFKPIPKFNPNRDSDRKEREYNRETYNKYKRDRRR